MSEAPIESIVEQIGDVIVETQRSAALPESQLRIITGKSRDDVLLAAELLSSRAVIAEFGGLKRNRETGEFQLIGATTGDVKKFPEHV